MKRTSESDKKTIFGSDFSFFGLNLDLKKFFRGFYLDWLLDIVASCHCMQYQGKLMNQT